MKNDLKLTISQFSILHSQFRLDWAVRAEGQACAQPSPALLRGRVRVAQAVVPALPLSYSPVVGEIGLEPMTWRLSGVYARAVGVRCQTVVDPAGFEPAASAMPLRCAPGCATGPCAGMVRASCAGGFLPCGSTPGFEPGTNTFTACCSANELCVRPRGRGTPHPLD